jgi:5-methylcytosine-specific restriction protein A
MKARREEYDRGSSAARGYGSKWRSARGAYLLENPLCVLCQEAGKVVPATVVDHIDPHRRDWAKFWNRLNWRASCKTCHDSVKQAAEKGDGTLRGFDVEGNPLDASHRWNQ